MPRRKAEPAPAEAGLGGEGRLQGLPPIADARTRLLILGSFPSQRSLAEQRYYAHPRNQFWAILQAIWPCSPLLTGAGSYEKRSEWLLAHGLGLWDVYAACERQGSLDAAIRQGKLNDFATLRRRCPQLLAVGFNGGESHRHAEAVAASLGAPPLALHRLPSTSPAHASWSFERKLAVWRAVAADVGLI